MVSKVVKSQNLENESQTWLKEVVANSPIAIKLGLEASDKINSSQSNHEYLSNILEKVLQSSDAKEGIDAFNNKRVPKWK